jgi:uncharacterized protein (UPF0261 family)
MITDPLRPVVALLGSLDTKGTEYAYLRDLVREAGARPVLIDSGTLGEPATPADHDRDSVAAAAGAELDGLRRQGDRDTATSVMAAGARILLADLVGAGEVDAVLSIGGSNAAYVMAEACAALPIGFPKVLVSTIASGNTRDYVRHADLILINPIVDINGLNRISRPILRNAVRSAVAMAAAWRSGADRQAEADDRPLAAVTMFGVTTACGSAVAGGLERAGLEPLTFHCTGVGGATMESLIATGMISAVADLTTTELADELVGGDCTAGPDRLTAAGRRGLPQVISVGALDMVNFWGRPVPPEFAHRKLIKHNPTVTLMRTTAEECRELGRRLAVKINAATGPVSVIFPTRGLSQLSVPGGPFEDRAADLALLTELRAGLRPELTLDVLETDINDPVVAARAVELLTGWMAKKENA